MVAVDERLCDLFEKHVPMSGPAKTVGGEIVRAINRIGYRWWNDGDQLGVDYGNETCNAAGRYLVKNCDKAVGDAVMSIWGCRSEHVYEAGLDVLKALVIEFLEERPEVFSWENTEDMWEYREWEDTHYEEEEEDEEDSDW